MAEPSYKHLSVKEDPVAACCSAYTYRLTLQVGDGGIAVAAVHVEAAAAPDAVSAAGLELALGDGADVEERLGNRAVDVRGGGDLGVHLCAVFEGFDGVDAVLGVLGDLPGGDCGCESEGGEDVGETHLGWLEAGAVGWRGGDC
jgi:hypothetical protein